MRLRPLSALVLLSIACRPDPLDRAAERYVELVTETSPSTVEGLLADVARLPRTGRAAHLERQLEAIQTQLRIEAGRKMTFDEESRLLYGVVAPAPGELEISAARRNLDRLLPGTGSLAPRYRSYQKRFLVPAGKIDAVLRRAIAESRRRTRENIELPEEESVQLEYVSGAPWPSFTAYRGGYQSVVQVNRDYSIPLGSVLEIATHEAYPGHHVLSVLLDRELVKGRGFPEYSVEPRVGPDALLREGLASYGLELLYPGEERAGFEKNVLFPLAGLDPKEAELHAEVEGEVRRLASLRIDAARRYLDRKRDRVQSAIWLEEEALVPAPWSFLAFVDRYRSYVITYTLGPEMVRRRLESSPDRWRAFVALLTVFVLSCSDDAPPPPRESKARVPHGDHAPHHGGVVLMHGDLHFEVVLDSEGGHRIYLTDAVRTELPASAASSVRITVLRPGAQPEELDLEIDEYGESWVARGSPVTEEDSRVVVAFVYQGGPYEIELPFVTTPPDPMAPH